MRINPPLLATGLLLNLTTLTAEATLTPYTSGGQSLVYSSVSDVTWTGDANLLGTMITSQGYNNVVNAIIAASPVITDTPNYFDGSYNNYDGENNRPFSGTYSITAGDFSANGYVSWFGAQAFVGYLNTINYAGSQQWALPTAGADPEFDYNQTRSQLGQLFYIELGGNLSANIPNTANFTNEQAYSWSGTEHARSPHAAWGFDMGYGYLPLKNYPLYAWAVSPGQVSAVPVPGATWLFGTGLVGLLGLKRCGHAG